jgi:hypothetical protein
MSAHLVAQAQLPFGGKDAADWVNPFGDVLFQLFAQNQIAGFGVGIFLHEINRESKVDKVIMSDQNVRTFSFL